MSEIKACPCGQIPKELCIVENNSKWSYVYGNCCDEWFIEFRTHYSQADKELYHKYAREAWNEAPRNRRDNTEIIGEIERFIAKYRIIKQCRSKYVCDELDQLITKLKSEGEG